MVTHSGVASKVLDIFSHPLEGCYLVLETEVASEFWMRQITERVKPVVEADESWSIFQMRLASNKGFRPRQLSEESLAAFIYSRGRSERLRPDLPLANSSLTVNAGKIFFCCADQELLLVGCAAGLGAVIPKLVG
jgi:hypothetical protein